MMMNSNFSLKSSIALLVLGVAIFASPKRPATSTLVTLSDYQPAIAAFAVGAIASVIQDRIV